MRHLLSVNNTGIPLIPVTYVDIPVYCAFQDSPQNPTDRDVALGPCWASSATENTRIDNSIEERELGKGPTRELKCQNYNNHIADILLKWAAAIIII